MAAWGYEFHLRVLKVSSMSISSLDSLISDAYVQRTGIEHRLVKKCGTCNWSYPAFIFSAMVEKKQFIRLSFSVSFTRYISCCRHALVVLSSSLLWIIQSSMTRRSSPYSLGF